jgi:hypothetical protein
MLSDLVKFGVIKNFIDLRVSDIMFILISLLNDLNQGPKNNSQDIRIGIGKLTKQHLTNGLPPNKTKQLPNPIHNNLTKANQRILPHLSRQKLYPIKDLIRNESCGLQTKQPRYRLL